MDGAAVFFLGRLAERILVVACGGLSLPFGWHLFKTGVLTDQSAEFSRKEISVRLQKVGPGVFFAIFGAAILALSLYRPLVVSDTEPESGHGGLSISYLAAETDQGALQTVRALNTQIQIITRDGVKRLGQPEAQNDLEDLLRTMDTTERLRDYIVVQKFGRDAMEVWRRHGSSFLRSPANVPQEHRSVLSNMVDWMQDTL